MASIPNLWVALRLMSWTALALFGVWLGSAIKMLWVIMVFVFIAFVGGALELRPKRGSRFLLIQAGIIGVGLCTIAAIAAIAGIAIIADELQGVPHRPWRLYGRLIYDPARHILGTAGGAVFWVACFGASIAGAVLWLRKVVGKDKTNAADVRLH